MFEKQLMEYIDAMKNVAGRQYFKAEYGVKRMKTIIYVTDNMEHAEENLRKELRREIRAGYGRRADNYHSDINEIEKEEINKKDVIVYVKEGE